MPADAAGGIYRMVNFQGAEDGPKPARGKKGLPVKPKSRWPSSQTARGYVAPVNGI